MFVGFDQAFARTELHEGEFYALLQGRALRNDYRFGETEKFLGYFLQFKVVQILQRRTLHTPSAIGNDTHFRATLSTAKNANSGFSQHELLYNLNKNLGAFVYYACPMLFDSTLLYGPPDLDTLRLADLATCPGAYGDNSKHYIYFDSPDADPLWCSEPTNGIALAPREAAEEWLARLNEMSPEGSRASLMKLLDGVMEMTKSLNATTGSLTILSWTPE